MVSPQGVTKQRFTWGGFAPRSNPLTLLYTIFWKKRCTPFLYCTFYWQPSVDVCIPFNCSKCTVFVIWINHKTRTFSRSFRNQRMHLLALLGLSDQNDRFCYPFIYLKPDKGTPPPPWAEPPHIGCYREYHCPLLTHCVQNKSVAELCSTYNLHCTSSRNKTNLACLLPTILPD